MWAIAYVTDRICVYFLVALCHSRCVFHATSSDVNSHVNSHCTTHVYIKISTAKVIANAVAKTLPVYGELCQCVTMQKVLCPVGLCVISIGPLRLMQMQIYFCVEIKLYHRATGNSLLFYYQHSVTCTLIADH